jgi:hypothetical protein
MAGSIPGLAFSANPPKLNILNNQLSIFQKTQLRSLRLFTITTQKLEKILLARKAGTTS